MAADAMVEPPSVEAVLAKFRSLLDRAREVKPVKTIDPPLPVADFAPEVASLGQGIFDGQSDSHRFAVVETAARKLFYETLVSCLSFSSVIILSDPYRSTPGVYGSQILSASGTC